MGRVKKTTKKRITRRVIRKWFPKKDNIFEFDTYNPRGKGRKRRKTKRTIRQRT